MPLICPFLIEESKPVKDLALYCAQDSGNKDPKIEELFYALDKMFDESLDLGFWGKKFFGPLVRTPNSLGAMLSYQDLEKIAAILAAFSKRFKKNAPEVLRSMVGKIAGAIDVINAIERGDQYLLTALCIAWMHCGMNKHGFIPRVQKNGVTIDPYALSGKLMVAAKFGHVGAGITLDDLVELNKVGLLPYVDIDILLNFGCATAEFLGTSFAQDRISTGAQIDLRHYKNYWVDAEYRRGWEADNDQYRATKPLIVNELRDLRSSLRLSSNNIPDNSRGFEKYVLSGAFLRLWEYMFGPTVGESILEHSPNFRTYVGRSRSIFDDDAALKSDESRVYPNLKRRIAAARVFLDFALTDADNNSHLLRRLFKFMYEISYELYHVAD